MQQQVQDFLVYDIRMKIKILSASLLAACLTAGTAWSQQVTGNTSNLQVAQNWNSFLVNLAPTVIIYRATTWSVDRQLLMVFDAMPPNCYFSMSFMLNTEKPATSNRTLDIRTVFYVDRNPAESFSAEFKTYANQRTIMIDVEKQDNRFRLYRQLLDGSMASVRFEERDGEHIQTFQFSMLGITSATNRAHSLCKASTASPAPSRPQNRSPNNSGTERNERESLRNLTPRNADPAPQSSSPTTPAPSNSSDDSLFKKAI